MTKKRNHRKLSLITTVIAFCFIATNAHAQFDQTLYNLRSVPQTTLANPAFMPEYDYHFGAPFLSSQFAGYGSSGLTYSDAFKRRSDDSLALDIPNITAMVKEKNNLNTRASSQLLNFGMRWQDWYFSASVSEIVDVNMMYSKDIIDLAGNGNASRIGEVYDLGSTAMKALQYREYALGAAFDYDDQWNFGARIKFLFGKSAVDTKVMEGKLTTSQDYYYLTTETNMTINTSVPANKKDTATVTNSEYLFYGGNFGMGFDLGATYKLDDQWSFSASVLDLGWIQYDRWLQTYSNEDVTWTYKGFDAMEFDGLSDEESDDKLKAVGDSLIDMFQLKESVEKFKVTLTAKIYLSANYKLSEVETVGALLRSEIFHNVWRPSFTLSYARKLDDRFSVIGSYTITNRSYANIGLGVVINYAPIQFYMTTDNVIGLIVPDKVKYTNFRFGVNIIFPGTNSGKTMTDI